MDNVFMKYVIPLLVLVAILVGALSIGKFFNISIGTYLGYILWFIGLTILYFILPRKKKSKFAKDDE
jgi:ABC-type transport system involved in cytochrome bd biosynthesis fused ATPase/permease subunit